MKPAQFKSARVALGYTQAAFAELLGVDPSSLRRWEMEPSVKSSIKPNKWACQIVDDMLAKRKIKIERL